MDSNGFEGKKGAQPGAGGAGRELGRATEKRLTGWDLAFLWFGAAVVIDEIWSGAQVTPLGLALGAAVIIAGKFAGNALLALVASMGAKTGLPTMVLSRVSFGIRGSVIPAIANILQLIGWTAYMLIVAAKAVGILFGADLGSAASYAIILVLGLITTAWAAGGQKYWKAANAIAAVLLIGLSLVMTYGVFSKHTIGELAHVAPPAGLSPMLIFDFVVAMAISWVPLAADYSRFAKSPRAAAAGTYWGYWVGSSWMYLIGLVAGMAYLAQNPGAPVESLEPNAVVLGALHGMRLISAGIVLIALSTITTTFLDVYSTAASALNLLPKGNETILTIIGGLLGTGLAFLVSMDQYVDFLLIIGIVFLPMFAVVAADWIFIRRSNVDTAAMDRKGGAYWYRNGWNAAAIIAWIIGMAVSIWAGAPYWMTSVFQAPAWTGWAVGATIPSFFITAIVYLLLAKLVAQKRS